MTARVKPRKWQVITETLPTSGGGKGAQTLTRVVSLCVFENPLAGDTPEDLNLLIDLSEQLGARLASRALTQLDAPVRAYGKGALVGLNGDIEHGAAVLHPALGKPMRTAIGGGKALVPSTCKVAVAGATLDLPVGAINDPWSFDEIDTLPFVVHDAPHPNEILLAIAYSAGGRPDPRLP